MEKRDKRDIVAHPDLGVYMEEAIPYVNVVKV